MSLLDPQCLNKDEITVIGAATGRGKTTFAVNLAVELISAGRRVLFIANEATRTDVATHVACLQLGFNPNTFKAGSLLQANVSAIINQVRVITNLSVIALDYRNDPRWVTAVECVVALIKSANEKYDAIIFDYYQLIQQSLSNPSLQPHQVHDQFAADLLSVLRNNGVIPIVLMGNVANSGFAFPNRFNGGRNILNVSSNTFELTSNYANQTLDLICHKARFGPLFGTTKTLIYQNGRLT